MKNSSIKFKLWANLLLFIAFFVAMWLLSYYSSTKISANLDSSKIEVMQRADKLKQALTDVEQLLGDAAQIEEAELLAEADLRANDFRSSVDAMMRIDPAHKEGYRKAKNDFNLYFTSARRVAELIISEGFTDELTTPAGRVKEVLPVLRKDVEGILTRSYETFTHLLDRSTRVAALLVTQNFVLLMTIIMLSAIVFPMVIRSITKPIEKLVDATNELAKGNLDVQAEVLGRDEIGALALSFNRMTRNLREKEEALARTTGELKISLNIREEMQSKIIATNTELKSANLKLQEADRLKTEFLASMSHELRTPLNAIINFTDQIIEDWHLLPGDQEWNEEAQGMLQRVLRSSHHLLSLINDLLDLAKIESGVVRMDITDVALRDIALDAVSSVSSLAKAKKLETAIEAPGVLPTVRVDERRILQVFINLLSNAIKFTEKGSVRIVIYEATDERKGLIAEVIDTGIGIPEEYRSIIFDRFRQVEGGDSRSHAGTGLGLNLVQELVGLHGGEVSVKSAMGRGTTFTVFLPFDPPVTLG